ncbi:mediator complex, subunit Med7 [Choanephora cucurbitarum]|nr:mediator complex, subunit Med7 [Choanephora cucurbitarum]
MEEQQSARSAWPDPPTYYKRYTTENLELLKQAQKTDDYESTLDFPLKQLEPPLPPTDDYSVFDQKWQIQDRLPTLEELQVKQLYPENQDIDRVKELKKLNRSLITQFLQLLDVLVEKPEEFGKHIENISHLFINMHHILNAYRPHQARETLRLLMENQLTKKRQQTAALKAQSKEALEFLQRL